MTTVRLIPPIGVRLSLSRMKRDIVQWYRKEDKRVFMSAVTAFSGIIGTFIIALGYTTHIGGQHLNALELASVFIGCALSSVGLLVYSFWLANQIAEAK